MSSIAKGDLKYGDLDFEDVKGGKCLVFHHRVSINPSWYLSVVGRVAKDAFIFWNRDNTLSKHITLVPYSIV